MNNCVCKQCIDFHKSCKNLKQRMLSMQKGHASFDCVDDMFDDWTSQLK